MKRVGGLLLFVLLEILRPSTGFCAGNIVVYASDTSMAGAAPPFAIAILDETNSQSFGTNHWICFSNVTSGAHAVEVICSNGYLSRESDTVPDAVNDPDSDYGNPRRIQVADNEPVFLNFQFDPAVTVSAVVRDAWTMERLENAAVELIINSGPSSNTVCSKYPWTAGYATNWSSGADGQFPSNTFLYATESCDLRVTLSGYQTLTSNNIIAAAAAGDEFTLEEVFMLPVDNNTNRIADAWETLYFGAGSNVSPDADADADGVRNRDEYVAGTDPTNALDYLTLMIVFGNSEAKLIWNTVPERTYRISGTTHITTGEWVQVAGSWEATNGQPEMIWVETNLDLSWNSNYRVDVMPCTWQGTNQTLINTNYPFSDGGEGVTNFPPLP